MFNQTWWINYFTILSVNSACSHCSLLHSRALTSSHPTAATGQPQLIRLYNTLYHQPWRHWHAEKQQHTGCLKTGPVKSSRCYLYPESIAGYGSTSKCQSQLSAVSQSCHTPLFDILLMENRSTGWSTKTLSVGERILYSANHPENVVHDVHRGILFSYKEKGKSRNFQENRWIWKSS